jgi:hypothetical protein
MSAVNNRYNHSTKKNSIQFDGNIHNVGNEAFRSNKTAPIRTKNRKTILRVTLTINKAPPPRHTSKRRYNHVNLRATNFKEQKNIPKR